MPNTLPARCSPGPGWPADGEIEAIRLLKITRNSAVKAQTTTMITIKAVVVTVDHDLRDRLAELTNDKLIVACSQLDTSGPIGDPEVAARHSLAALATCWIGLHEEIKTHTRQLETLTSRLAPQMIDRFGVGFDTAAEPLVAAGENTDRVHSEAAFAKLCGVCPIPAGSGKTSGRHRLNRG